MHPKLEVYLDRLQRGELEVIQKKLSSDFIDVDEPDLKFSEMLTIKGKAYLVSEHLVIHLEIEAEAVIPCVVCNEPVHAKLRVPQFYHTKELREIKGKIYNYTDPLREAILLEVPSYMECQKKCPKRKELEKYRPSEGKRDRVSFPFVDLK